MYLAKIRNKQRLRISRNVTLSSPTLFKYKRNSKYAIAYKLRIKYSYSLRCEELREKQQKNKKI